MVELTINEQKAEFDERILDRWGNEFRFDHVKGLAEWLKNSVDAYIRADVADNDQHIFVRFIVTKGRTPSQIEVIDFVGMTHEDIVKAFLAVGRSGGCQPREVPDLWWTRKWRQVLYEADV